MSTLRFSQGPIGDGIVPPSGGGATGPTGPTGPMGGAFISVPTIVPDLEALPTAGMSPGEIVHVQSVWDYWSYDPFDNASVIDNITVASTDTLIGRWHRMDIADQLWIQQTSWYINPALGSDEDDGSTPGTALATHDEYNRRVGGPCRQLDVGASSITIGIIGNVPNVVAHVTSLGSASVTYVGLLPPPVAGAVASVTPADPTTQTALTVTIGAPWGGQALVHDTTNGTWWWAYDIVTPTKAVITPPCTSGALPTFVLGPDPAPGNVLSIYPASGMASVSGAFFAEGPFLSAPGIVIEELHLDGVHIEDAVTSSLCLLGPVDATGAGPTWTGCSDIFTEGGAFHTWLDIATVVGGCFFDGFQFIRGIVRLICNNHIQLGSFQTLFISDEIRLIESTTRPASANLSLQVDSYAIASVSCWGTLNSNVSVEIGSAFILQSLLVAQFNPSTVALGGGGPGVILPPLLPGLVVPATAPCTTPAQLFAAPFFGNAIDYTRNARFVF